VLAPWIRGVETDTIPKMIVANGIYLRAPGDDHEQLGNALSKLRKI